MYDYILKDLSEMCKLTIQAVNERSITCSNIERPEIITSLNDAYKKINSTTFELDNLASFGRDAVSKLLLKRSWVKKEIIDSDIFFIKNIDLRVMAVEYYYIRYGEPMIYKSPIVEFLRDFE
jgi:hypothetical protein